MIGIKQTRFYQADILKQETYLSSTSNVFLEQFIVLNKRSVIGQSFIKQKILFF